MINKKQLLILLHIPDYQIHYCFEQNEFKANVSPGELTTRPITNFLVEAELTVSHRSWTLDIQSVWTRLRNRAEQDSPSGQ